MTINIESKVITGNTLVLEPIGQEHAQDLYLIGKESSLWRYLPIEGFRSIDEASQWVEEALVLGEKGYHITYVIKDKISGTVLGSTRYFNIRKRDHGLEIGYSWVGKQYQRTHVNTETKYLMLKNAFEENNVYRVEIKTDLRNIQSQKAIERIGAMKEGVLRRHMVVKDGYIRDTVCYSITDLDWSLIKEKLQTLMRNKI